MKLPKQFPYFGLGSMFFCSFPELVLLLTSLYLSVSGTRPVRIDPGQESVCRRSVCACPWVFTGSPALRIYFRNIQYATLDPGADSLVPGEVLRPKFAIDLYGR